jgi:hypothetical protein
MTKEDLDQALSKDSLLGENHYAKLKNKITRKICN